MSRLPGVEEIPRQADGPELLSPSLRTDSRTIVTVSASKLTSTAAIYDFSIVNSTLAANTRYWIGLVSTVTGANWKGTTIQAWDTGTFAEYIQQSAGVVYSSNTNFASRPVRDLY